MARLPLLLPVLRELSNRRAPYGVGHVQYPDGGLNGAWDAVPPTNCVMCGAFPIWCQCAQLLKDYGWDNGVAWWPPAMMARLAHVWGLPTLSVNDRFQTSFWLRNT